MLVCWVQQFGSRSGPRFCQTWSGSKLFAKVISRWQKLPLAGKELRHNRSGSFAVCTYLIVILKYIYISHIFKHSCVMADLYFTVKWLCHFFLFIFFFFYVFIYLFYFFKSTLMIYIFLIKCIRPRVHIPCRDSNTRISVCYHDLHVTVQWYSLHEFLTFFIIMAGAGRLDASIRGVLDYFFCSVVSITGYWNKNLKGCLWKL